MLLILTRLFLKRFKEKLPERNQTAVVNHVLKVTWLQVWYTCRWTVFFLLSYRFEYFQLCLKKLHITEVKLGQSFK